MAEQPEGDPMTAAPSRLDVYHRLRWGEVPRALPYRRGLLVLDGQGMWLRACGLTADIAPRRDYL